MTPFKRKYDPKYAQVLLRIAAAELETVKSMLAHPAGRPEATCFLAQQVVEKALKAVICHFGKAVPLIHDISGLLAAVPDEAGRPPNDTHLTSLTEFATVRRYEEGAYRLSSEDVAAVVSSAENVVQWAARATNA
ncbi:MAG: HEPN domain-containing protein [Bdellovibrionota bacterium]